jgi:hypothetical protein
MYDGGQDWRFTMILAEPKKIIAELAKLRVLKTFASPDAVNTTTSPQLPKYVSAAFGSLALPWKPGHLRSAYVAICCHRFKPKNMTEDIFIAEILGPLRRAELQGFLHLTSLQSLDLSGSAP